MPEHDAIVAADDQPTSAVLQFTLLAVGLQHVDVFIGQRMQACDNEAQVFSASVRAPGRAV